jgi:hypothetical protein
MDQVASGTTPSARGGRLSTRGCPSPRDLSQYREAVPCRRLDRRAQTRPRDPGPCSSRRGHGSKALLAEAPRWTAGKQRLIATQLHGLLRAEGFSIGRTTVKDFVHEWRRKRAEVFVPLVYRPGDLGLIDFFEVFVDVAGKRIKAFLFVLRLMASGRDFAWLFPRQDQTCFLEAHVRAFEHLGGV